MKQVRTLNYLIIQQATHLSKIIKIIKTAHQVHNKTQAQEYQHIIKNTVDKLGKIKL